MASDTILMWAGVLFIEWFFLARCRGEGEDRNVGIENLGWFLIFITSWIGIGIIENGESAMALIFGGVGMLISLIKFIANVND